MASLFQDSNRDIRVIIIVTLTVYLTSDTKLKGEALSIIAVYSFATLRLFPIFQQIYMAIAGAKRLNQE